MAKNSFVAEVTFNTSENNHLNKRLSLNRFKLLEEKEIKMNMNMINTPFRSTSRS